MRTLAGLYQGLVLSVLGRIENGLLELRDGETTYRFGNSGPRFARVHVHDNRFYSAVALRGHIGAADAYAHGWWTADDVTTVVRVFLQNRVALDGLETGWAGLLQPVRWLANALQPNSRRGSRQNIAAHYDLGNEFFATFLDETFTYSCAYFERPDDTLKEASIAKYDRLCEKLDLQPTDHVLEIGTGWGGFAVHAARRYGCRVTTTTISPKQFSYVRALIHHEQLDDRVTLLNRDYRDLSGRFDKLVSIEMIEAIGYRQFNLFFEKCAELLRSDGLAAVQAITIQDHLYEQARKEIDFIKKYIFPGSCIPSVSALTQASRKTDLRLVHAEDIGLHYAETLSRWRVNFNARSSEIERMGFSDWFRRLWDFYFCYCEGGFREMVLGDAQLVFAKPQAALNTPKTRTAMAGAV